MSADRNMLFARNPLTGLLAAALLSACLPACDVDETVSPVEGLGTTTATETTTTETTSGTGGSGGGPGAPIRTVEQRNPFGNVAATDNLLWDGDFEWSSPFSDQYGWLFGPPYGYAFPAATIGAACRSGIKCVTLPKNKGIIGIGVGVEPAGLDVTVYAKPSEGNSCASVDVSLIDIESIQQNDVAVPENANDPDSTGWCLYRAQALVLERKVYLLIANHGTADVTIDDAVVRPTPKNAPPPPPPPMGPLSAERALRHEEARAALLALRGPVIPPKSPARRAFEEHLSR